MRPTMFACGMALLVAVAAGCQDPIPPAPSPTPSPMPSPTPTPSATPTPDTSLLTPPPNFFVQPGRIYTYRRTPFGAPPETVKVEIGAIEGDSYSVIITTEKARSTDREEGRHSQTFGVFPFGLTPADLLYRAIDQYPLETVQVPAGSFPVRRVVADGATYDFSEEFGILVRSVTPAEGGQTTLELLRAEPSRYRL